MPMLELLFYTILGALATWRVASLLYDEPGPWGTAIWFRERLGIEHDNGDPVIYPKWLQPLECFWCLGLIGAIPWGVYVALTLSTLKGLAIWLATSTIIIILERWILRSKSRL
jgi:hypothetical protein